MNSRLAQIIAASVDKDGVPDKVKIYEALKLTPDSPETFLVEAYMAADDSIERLKTAESRLLAAQQSAMKADVDRAVKALKDHEEVLAQDAKLRSKWLGIAVAVPVGLCLILVTASWLFLKFKAQ